MSQINDALQRARKTPPPPPAVSAAPVRPVQTVPARSSLIFFLPVLVVLLAAIGGALVWAALQKRKSTTVEAKNPRVAMAAPAIETKTAAPSETLPDKTVAAEPAPVVDEKAVASAESENNSAAQIAVAKDATAPTNSVHQTIVVPAPSQSALPKLQGIYYRPGNASAVINGRTVYIGNSVRGFKVTAITPDSVEVVADGQTNVLWMRE